MTQAELIGAAIARHGSERKLADALGITQPWVNNLKRGGKISAEIAVRMEEKAGIPRHKLRPDLFPPPPSPLINTGYPVSHGDSGHAVQTLPSRAGAREEAA